MGGLYDNRLVAGACRASYLGKEANVLLIQVLPKDGGPRAPGYVLPCFAMWPGITGPKPKKKSKEDKMKIQLVEAGQDCSHQ